MPSALRLFHLHFEHPISLSPSLTFHLWFHIVGGTLPLLIASSSVCSSFDFQCCSVKVVFVWLARFVKSTSCLRRTFELDRLLVIVELKESPNLGLKGANKSNRQQSSAQCLSVCLCDATRDISQ